MFRIEFFVEDKRLASALLALVGIAHGQPSILPVINAKKKGNGLAPAVEGNTLERFVAALQPLKGSTIKASDVRAMMPSLGLSDKSYSYLLKKVVDNKLIKKTGKGQGTATRYTVLL